MTSRCESARRAGTIHYGSTTFTAPLAIARAVCCLDSLHKGFDGSHANVRVCDCDSPARHPLPSTQNIRWTQASMDAVRCWCDDVTAVTVADVLNQGVRNAAQTLQTARWHRSHSQDCSAAPSCTGKATTERASIPVRPQHGPRNARPTARGMRSPRVLQANERRRHRQGTQLRQRWP
jgi:hypothetical protein